jgi:CheY-like chemotaxis protein/DNA-binding CsgD family transcriptional regulator
MSQIKILIVDDVVENIQTITSYFEQLQPEYRLFQATKGHIAFEIAKRMKVDLIISDWEMPGMSGMDLLKVLKEDAQTSHIPVIIVTGVMLSPADLDNALLAGAFDYLRKPVDPVELAARTNSAICFVSLHLKELAAKNLELTEKSIMLARNNQFNIEVSKRLKQLEGMVAEYADAKSLIKELIENIEQKTREDNWGHFEVAFQNVHPEFSKSITNRYHNLTPAELKQCILIRLGMSNKDMASVLYQTPDSIKVTRSRIRRKIGISNDTNLQSFLMMI